MKMLYTVLLLAVLAGTAQAAPITSANLRDNCTAFVQDSMLGATDQLLTGLCVGYVAGYFDTMDGMAVHFDNGNAQVVFAPNVTVAQIVRVFYKYVNAHPQCENESPAGTLTAALIEAKLIGFKPIAEKAVDQ